jgi:hypothetical protein
VWLITQLITRIAEERAESSQRIVVVHLSAFISTRPISLLSPALPVPPPTMFDDYTYDFPVPSSSKLSSTPLHSNRRRRSQSPTKLHLPHSISKHSSSRESDISRLLDPSYSSSKNASNAAYVDHHGDLHDPDYRHFPPVARHNTKTLTRPRWELASGDAIDEEDDEAVHVDAFSVIRPASPRRHRDSTSTYRATTSYASSYPHSTFTAPTSFDSDETVLEEEDDPFEDNEKVTKCPVAKKTKKRSRRGSKAPTAEAEIEDESRPIIADASTKPGEEYVPSQVAEEHDWT